MSRTRVWVSIVLWAAAAGLGAIAAVFIVAALYPAIHPGILAIAAFLGASAIYGVRGLARQRGWAVASYAPQGK